MIKIDIEIDKRSLILFRIVLASLYIYICVVIRLFFFKYYSVENGVFPNKIFDMISNKPFLVNILLNDVYLYVYILFCFLFGFLILIGRYVSLSCFMSVILYLLLGRRFISFYYGTDEFLLVLIFSLGFVYLLNPNIYTVSNNRITFKSNPFILMLIGQITIVYFFTGINKTSIEWWNGSAVNITMFNVLLNKKLALHFVNNITVGKIFTYLTLIFEIGFPFWIYLAFKNDKIKFLLGFFILCFHWAIGLFADVSFYKYLSLALFVLLIPTEFYDKFKLFQMLHINANTVQRQTNNKILGYKLNIAKYTSIALLIIFLICAINASILRQNQRYKFIKNENIINIMNKLKSYTYSPFRQYWMMFAPSPPLESGYIAFEYCKNKKCENINIYKNSIYSKNYPFYHPMHLLVINNFSKIAKGNYSNESDLFDIINAFQFEVNNNINIYSNRQISDYKLVLYIQTYSDFVNKGKYIFNKEIIAEY